MADLTVLTGATRGLGRAMYENLARRGEPLILVGRNLASQDWDQDGASATVTLLEADFSNAGSPEGAVALERTIRTGLKQHSFERLTFINNAGTIEPIGNVGRLAADTLAICVAVNQAAPMVIANACCESASERGIPLRIINISSGAAARPIPGWSGYCGTKAGAHMFFDVLVLQGNVDVRHVDPGVIDTDMQATIRAAGPDRFPLLNKFQALADEGRLQKPADVAERILADHFK